MWCRNSSLRKFALHSWVVLFLVTSLSVGLKAQSRMAEMTGVVSDQQGASVIGASISVSHEATGVKVTTSTNEAGLYRVQNLISGPYRVEVSLTGFKTFVRTGYVLEVGQIGRMDAVLEVGEISQQVEVSAAVPLLQTESSETSKILLQRDIDYRPNLNRDYNTLLTQTAIFGGSNDIQYAGSHRHGTGLYVNGAQQQRRDDSSPTDWNSTTDFIKEAKVLANGYSSEFKGPQAIVLETKSGTNEIHGTAYFYMRDRSLNANPWGALTKLPFRRTEPGFTIGGPIVKNKTHYFVGYQYRKDFSSSPNFLTVPSLLQRRGDFSQTYNAAGQVIPVYDPATTRPDPNNPGRLIRDQFPGNIIPQDRLDPVGAKILSFYALPNQAGTITGAQNFYADRESRTNSPQYNFRVDHQWNDRHKTFGSYVGTQADNKQTDVWPNPGTDGKRAPSVNPSRTYTFAHNYTPGVRWVLDTSFSMLQRQYQETHDGWQSGYPEQIGLKGVDPKAHFPNITATFGFSGTQAALPGYSFLGGSTWANQGAQLSAWSYSFAQRFAYAKGRHNVKFGVEVLPWRHRYAYRYSPSGELGFGVQTTSQPGVSGTGNGAASLLVGLPMSGRIDDIAPDRTISSNFYAGYVQEDWKVRNDFTLNLGLRWERDSGETVRSAATGDLDYLTFFNTKPVNPVSGTPGVITYAGKDGPQYNWIPSWKHFQPRVGFAWQVRPKTVIRANSGIFYRNPMGGNRISGVWELGAYGLAGFTSGFWSSPDNGITHPFRLRDGFPAIVNEPAGPGFGAVPVGQPARLNVLTTLNGDDKAPQAYQISTHFGIQHELPSNLLISVGYYGNLTRHHYNFLELNQVDPKNFGPGNGQARRPFPQYGNVTLGIARFFNANYHAMELVAEKRLSQGLSFNTSYSFNKNLTNYDPWNAYDLRNGAKMLYMPQHRFVGIWTYDLPWGPGRPWMQSGPGSRILGGWVTAGTYTWRSGSFLDVRHFTDTTNGFLQGNQGVNLNGNPNVQDSQRTMDRWFDTSVFSAPAQFTLGNAGRTIVEGPGGVTFDFALTKNTRITERYSVEFHADFINAFNHPNFGGPDTTLGSPNFGRVVSKSGNRNIQLGVKFIF